MAKNRQKDNWLSRQLKDTYVKRARAEGFRSRAVFKLMEVQQRYAIIKNGMQILDLGAAPGSWSQYASATIAKGGGVVAVDRLPIDPISGVFIIQGDFTETLTAKRIQEQRPFCGFDVLLSDMAPNLSGTKSVDQARSIYLAELALAMAEQTLKSEGDFLVKLFQGEGFDEFNTRVRQSFVKAVVKKPKASRPKSREVYLLARGFKDSSISPI